MQWICQELAARYGIPLREPDPQAAAEAEALQHERQRLLAWRERQWRECHQARLDDLNRLDPAATALIQRGLRAGTAPFGFHRGAGRWVAGGGDRCTAANRSAAGGVDQPSCDVRGSGETQAGEGSRSGTDVYLDTLEHVG